ncbi:MAG: histidine phosphatase family protein [Acidobacteriales bacterium]|nr:histidine phosphatase family protein [Terriglobales bacterium]
MTIYFLRHASAGETRKDPKKDERRGLDSEGIQQSYQLAKLFFRLDVAPDLIITSPLKRAMQTAAMVANELGYDDKLKIEKTLKPEAKWEDFRPMLKSQKGETLIIVGHSPNLSQFIGRMISDAGHRAEIDLRKGGAARVDYNGRNGELQWLLTPKLIQEANAGVEIGPPPTSAPKVAKEKTQGTRVAKVIAPAQWNGNGNSSKPQKSNKTPRSKTVSK